MREKLNPRTIESYLVEDALTRWRNMCYDEEDGPIKTWEEFMSDFRKTFYP